jgi:phenylalanyl-tRNA synthetase beta chain
VRVPVSWLREYVPIDVPVEELAARLLIASCEVERIETRGVPDEDGNVALFRVGRVLEAAKHPNADRLQLCQVDVGEGEPRQIVCGAWNFGTGATVAVALPGARLPGGVTLEERPLRGAVSRGMILSERELELGPDHTGILVLSDGPEPGTPLADVLPLTEHVLEIETLHNRPDMLGIYGIAREVSALFDVDLAPMPGSDHERAGDEPVDITVEDLQACPRYVGRLFRDVHIGPSPPWLRARLVAVGMRPISNVVDVTNYVMFALGSPLHAFDQSKLHEGRIVVRRAYPGEQIRTLDGTVRALDPRDLVIADADRAVAIAGIMGGEDSEVTDGTSAVLLEAANFEPVTIMHSTERLRLRSEASNRWEKGVDPEAALQAARLATELLVELTGGRWTGHTDVRAEPVPPPKIRFRPTRTDEVTGLVVPEEEQRRILTRLGFRVSEDWTVDVPTWRASDVTREIDLVEEVARFKLDEVPFTMPTRTAMFGLRTKPQRVRREIQDILLGFGFSEAYTWSLVPDDPTPGAIRLPDPISSEQAVLRTSLARGLTDVASRNLEAGNEEIAIFELAHVYLPSGEELPHEPWHVGAIVEGGFRRAKGAMEGVYAALHVEPSFEAADDLPVPGRGARTAEGWVVELRDPELPGAWGYFELDVDSLGERVPDIVLYHDVITYPAVKQDLAFAVDESVPAGALIAAAREAAGPELREIRVFDVYHGKQVGPGKKSVAFTVAFQSPERTLSDDDAAGLRDRIVRALADRFGATLRA